MNPMEQRVELTQDACPDCGYKECECGTCKYCDKPIKGRGLCRTHYMNWWRRGNALLFPPRPKLVSKSMSIEEGFWLRVNKSGPAPDYRPDLGPCWLWTGCIAPNGYGQFNRHRGRFSSHRFSYELVKGQIPDGLEIDHLCRVRHCVNPEHLELVTTKENSFRGVGFAAVNARKTHCPKGHAYSPDNLYFTKEGYRICRTCRIDRERRKHAQRKAS